MNTSLIRSGPQRTRLKAGVALVLLALLAGSTTLAAQERQPEYVADPQHGDEDNNETDKGTEGGTRGPTEPTGTCLLYTSDAADE